MTESNNGRVSFDINELVKSTYNKIAEWHNENATSSALQHLSFELVSEIIEESYRHLDLKVGFDLEMDQETRNKVEEEKANKKRRLGVNDMDNLSDEELLREIMKRKNPQAQGQ
jgi:hypothetical protein